MAEVPLKVFRVKFTDWNGEDRVQTMTPQNWSRKQHGVQNAANLQKFLEDQWKGNGAVIHSVEEQNAVVDAEKFTADRLSPDARPRVVEAPAT
jgi:hypothetical protein